MVGNASVVNAYRDFGDKWYYLKLQSGWAVLGLAGFFFVSRFPYPKLEKLAPLFLFSTLALLLLVLIPGVSSRILGARRWISLAGFTFQPAELAKLTLSVYWAALLKKTSALIPFLASLGLAIGLIMLEPDLGTTLVLTGTALMTYFGSGGKLIHLASLLPLGALALAILIFIAPYRLDRLRTFFDYSRDLQGSSYHIHQVLLSLGSGGVFGVGLGQSRQKYEFLPEVATDSIFAVIAEELGLIGAALILVVFFVFFLAGLKIAQTCDQPFGRNLALALTSWISIQAFINISAMVALIPLTGIPLPFISYGGSSLVITLISSGILVNISRQS